jgi:hypothetical protein
MKYVDFLIRNFDVFKNDKRKNLNGNMNASKSPNESNRIPVDKYLKGRN